MGRERERGARNTWDKGKSLICPFEKYIFAFFFLHSLVNQTQITQNLTLQNNKSRDTLYFTPKQGVKLVVSVKLLYIWFGKNVFELGVVKTKGHNLLLILHKI